MLPPKSSQFSENLDFRTYIALKSDTIVIIINSTYVLNIGNIYWPDQIKDKMHQKIRKALLKRVKSRRYKLENNKIYYQINFGVTESPQHANGN